MIYVRFKICAAIMGLVLGITGIKAQGLNKDAPQTKEAYKQLWETKNISAVAVSPDNKHVLVSFSKPEMDSTKKDVTSQWISNFFIKNNCRDSKTSNEKVYHQVALDFPSWLPDSQRVSGLAQGDKGMSLWVSPTKEFKPQQILELEDDIIGYRWSPDGKKLAVLVDKKVPADAIKFVVDVDQVVSTKLYVMDIDEKFKVSNLTSLTPDIGLPETYRPEYSNSFTWTPDSQHIAYSFFAPSKGQHRNFAQIDLVNVTTKEFKTLAKGEGTNLFPKISPDGKYLAYITNILPENADKPIRVYGTDAARVCIIDLGNNDKRCLAPTPNENPILVGWRKDGKSLFVVDQEGLTAPIYELGIDGKSAVKFTTGQKIVSGIQVNPSGEFIGYIEGDLQMPPEAYITPTNAFKPEKITSFSTSRAKDEVLVETVQWKSKDKKFDLEGVFIYPKKREFPFALITVLNDYSRTVTDLGYVGDFMNYPLSLLSLLEKGYGIFIPNRRGTNGYGVRFRQAIYKELGGEEFQDVLTGIDALIEQKRADPNRLALWGWGYGGYLSAWALTQTDRFKTVIVGAGISNLVSQLGTTADPSLLEAIMGGPFWKDWKTWREKSPISHVKNMKTPTFIQTGNDDVMIDRSQSEELFFPLKTQKMPVQMITYLQEGHNFYKPHIILMAIHDLEAWLEKHFSLESNSQEQERH